ncbi:prepilin-type N-terminal cleavage/methylation domain-containing protein [bacterium]|nr:prepilin-type N-terminal cleavage/methylation domain-containing protein [bacterium]
MKSQRGFTLIELLIVVAIIAILAAIAVPNFLEAQTRSKVSRVKADMRTVATAMESYRVDFNKYPPVYIRFGSTEIKITPVVQRYVRLTTPIAYITTVPLDPFFGGRESDLPVWGLPVFDYWSYDEPYLWGPRRGTSWWVSSYGPDKEKNGNSATAPDGSSFSWSTPYDPTNGSISAGEITRLSDGFQTEDYAP